MKIQPLMLFALLSVQIFTFTLSTIAFASEPTAFNSWAKTAKLGGAAVWTGMAQSDIDLILSNLQAQKVSVIEADSQLSNYLSDAQFEQQLSLMRKFASSAHKRGLRVVWYYPSLEVITVNGKNISQTMAKDHPDWVQIGMNGVPNVFYGGGGQVFWVAQDDESAWMSPSSPGYRQYFFDRVSQIAETGIDGLWVDVPIYADFGPTEWSGFNPHAIARFLADTGLTAPSIKNWNDPVWRRWITWRHEEITRFLSDLTTVARAKNPEFPIFAETLPTDYNGATVYGLDGGYLKYVEGLTHIWEVDTMSNTEGMRNAKEDDWISFISAFKYSRAASGEKPSWVFNYGKQVEDATLVMAEALATGNNPYELQVPEMTTTVGDAFRTRMFDWAQKYSPYLFQAQTGARVAVLHSSPSRDYVDKYQGLGMFTTWESNGDPLWWADSATESAYQRQYLAEYRGMVKMLVHEHIPFNSVVNPADADELSHYDVVILPNVEAISSSESAVLRQYVANGGNLLVTGPNPTGLDDYGTIRTNYALSDLLGFDSSTPLPAEHEQLHPSGGKVNFFSSLLGKDYFVSNSSAALQILSSTIQASSNVPLTTTADRRVHFELSHLNNETILQFVNFIGVNGTFSIVPTTFSTSLDIPAGKQVSGVALTSPDQPELSPITYTVSNQKVTFDVPLTQYALVVVSFDGASTPEFNHTPIAGKDFFTTNINTTLAFTEAMLMSNDGDLDGDLLVITAIDSANIKGSFASQGNGNYTYTPLPDFTGIDTLSYTISDGKGGVDTGFINLNVTLPATTYYPEAVVVTTGSYDWGTLASFNSVDNDTYDILSAANSGTKEIDWYATATISEQAQNLAKIKISHTGQYSKAGVIQHFYVYNFHNSNWEHVDTTAFGIDDDVPVVWVIDATIEQYVSAQSQVRVRIEGSKSVSDLYSWSNELYWEVTQSVNVVPPPVNQAPVATFTSTCTNLNCALTDTSTDSDGNITEWLWSFGDGASSTLQNPNHTYTTAGTYAINLTVTDNDGTTNSLSHNVTVNSAPPVNQAPVAAFTSTCTNLNCVLTDTSTDSDGNITSWNWSFGDGASATLQNPSHSYTAGGTYTVNLTVTDNDGATNNLSHNVTVSTAPPVNQAPVAAFTSTCTNLNCALTDTSTDSDGNITSWNWSFGDGASSTQQNPNHTYTTAGTYAVNLTVTDNDGDTNNLSHNVTVSPAPPVNQAPGAAFTSTCTDFNCALTDTSTDSDGNITGWLWSFGDGASSTLQNPNHTYVSEGTYAVSLTVTDNDGATSNVSHSIIINTPSAPTTTVYYPDTVNITSGNYDWGSMASFLAPDSDTYDINSAVVSGNHTTDWYVTTSISETPEDISQIKLVNMGQYSQAGVSQHLYVYNFKNSAWDLIDTATVGNEDDLIVSWIITTDIPAYISAQNQLRVRVTGSKGATSFYSWSNSIYWEVTHLSGGGTPPANSPPTATLSSACTDLHCDLTDTSTDSDGNITAWSWNFGDNSSSSLQHPNHSYTTEGTYTISLTVTDDEGSSDSISHTVTVSVTPPVNQEPTAAFTSSCTNLSCQLTDTSTDSDGSLTAWHWEFGDGEVSAQQYPDHTFTSSGTYVVSLTVTDNAGATNSASNSVTVTAVPALNQAPTAAFTSSCTHLSCNYTDTSTDSDGVITAWNWSFGDGSTSILQHPSHNYASEGTYTVNLTVTDDDGASSNVSHTVTIDTLSTPSTKTYYPDVVNTTSGSYDWGTMASFITTDSDTYDVYSASVGGVQTIDWSITTTISESPDKITQLKMINFGQYSQTDVSQRFYIYNFKNSAWELVDTAVIGNEDDVAVLWSIDTAISDYVSAQGLLRVRITASKNASNFYSWLNAQYWEVTHIN